MDQKVTFISFHFHFISLKSMVFRFVWYSIPILVLNVVLNKIGPVDTLVSTKVYVTFATFATLGKIILIKQGLLVIPSSQG